MKKIAYSYKDFLQMEDDEITHLTISSEEEFDPANLTKLKSLSLNFRDFEQLPEWFKELKDLENLEMIYCKVKQLPDWFASLSRLKVLNLQNALFTEIPSAILKLENLEELDLSYGKLERMPSGFKLPQLKKVKLVTYSELKNREALDALMFLPSLEEYELPRTMSLKYSYGKANPDVYYFHKFFRTLCKKRNALRTKDGLHQEAIEALCWLFKQQKKELDKIDVTVFYSLLNCSVSKYREMAISHLSSISNGKKEKIDGKKLFVLGKLKVKKAEQAEWIAETGATLEKKFNAKVDYVVLGENPKAKLQEVLDIGVNILMEKDVWEIKDSAYLMEEVPEVTENLKDLLQNPDPINLDLALQLMEQGGMPGDVIEELIALMLFHTNNKIRKKSKIIFNRYLSIDLPENTKKALAKQAYRIKDDKKVTKFLEELVRDTILDLDILAYGVYRASGKQQAQGLCLSLPYASSKVIRDYVNKYGVLDLKPHTRLASGLFLERLPAAIEELAKEGGRIRLDDLKFKDEKEYLRLKGFKELNLKLWSIRKLPATIFSNPALEKLDITAPKIKKLDPAIGNLSNLVNLTMYMTGLTKLPKEIGKLKNLRRLNLSLKEGDVPEFIFNQKNLESLYMGSDVTNFPKAFERLKKLKSLTMYAAKSCSFEEQERLDTFKKVVQARKKN